MNKDRGVLKSSKPHIGIFGRRNYGKSSLINALAGQDVAIVSGQAGTTTDPVYKAFEITGFGPVIFIDTAGIDDEGELGIKRVTRTYDVIDEIDCGVLVIAHNTFGEYEKAIIGAFEETNVPYLVVHNKSDLDDITDEFRSRIEIETRTDVVSCSTVNNRNIPQLVELISKHVPASLFNNPTIVGDIVSHGDVVLLITPIDVQAPKGRLIMPQVQTIRDCLDNDCISVVLKERELDIFWKKTGIKPALAVTDSQEFLKAAASVPTEIPLTSFSILFARLKGDFNAYIEGTPAISKLRDGDRVLILESCSHHVAADDIGRVKIPRWISNFTGKRIIFETVAGLNNPPRPITDYSLVIQCGGCMLTRTQVMNRILPAIKAGIPVSNYGMTIAYCLGIFDRALKPFYSSDNKYTDYL